MSRRGAIAWAVPVAGAALLGVFALRPSGVPAGPTAGPRAASPDPPRPPVQPEPKPPPPAAPLDPAVKTLRDRAADPSARTRAAQEAAATGGDEAVDAIADVLRKDAAFPFRPLLAKALGDARSPRAVAPLVEALRADRAADVRIHAARALGRYPDAPEGLQALRDATLADASEHVRLAALQTYLAARGAEGRDFARSIADQPGAPAPLRAMASRWLAERPR